MATVDDILVRDLNVYRAISGNEAVVAETRSGTKLINVDDLANYVYVSHVYDTVDEMVNEFHEDGDIVYTLGYNKQNDGAGAMYAITYEPSTIPDGGSVIAINSNAALRARLLTRNDYVNVAQYGAYGDGVHDDSAAIKAAMRSGMKVTFTPGKTYRIMSTINISKSMIVDVNNATIIPIGCYAFTVGVGVRDVTFNNLCCNLSNNGDAINLMGLNDNIVVNGIVVKYAHKTSIPILAKNPIGLNITRGDFAALDGEDASESHAIFVNAAHTDRVITNVTVSNCIFENYHSGVIMVEDGDIPSVNCVNVTNCKYIAGNDADSNVIYIAGGVDRSTYKINISEIFAEGANTIVKIGAGVSGTANISDISGNNVIGAFDFCSNVDTLHVHLSGLMNFTGEFTDQLYSLFKFIGCTLYNSANIVYNEERYKPISDDAVSGRVVDGRDPMCSTERICNYAISKILNSLPQNACVNWIGPLVLSEIKGNEGQVICVRSSTGQEVTSNGNIIMYPEDPFRTVKEPLPKFDYVKLKCTNGTWKRVKEV